MIHAASVLEFTGKFHFPDQENSKLAQHVAFGDGWVELLERKWEPETMMDHKRDRIFAIERKIDSILDELQLDGNGPNGE